MLKKTITYTDFNDTERTEDFYFNLSKAELTEWELTSKGGLGNLIEEIINANDNKKIIELFKTIVLKAYGEKSEDGKRFVKSAALREAFEQSAAYDALFMELLTNEKTAADFINGIVPSDLAQKLKTTNIAAIGSPTVPAAD